MPKAFFAGNPLSLSVPDPVFEAWLRDTGYLEILDERTTTDPSLPSSSGADTTSSTAAPPKRRSRSSSFVGLFSFFRTFVAVLTLNPFAKLAADDFSGATPAWTLEFIGGAASYSWPAGSSQARMRAQENVRRYARNYTFLAVIFFACSLYQMPIALVGLIASLVIWELLRFCADKSELMRQYPTLRQVLARIALISTMVILYLCHLQLALIYAAAVSYAVMILHASLRKLTPNKIDKKGLGRRKLSILQSNSPRY